MKYTALSWASMAWVTSTLTSPVSNASGHFADSKQKHNTLSLPPTGGSTHTAKTVRQIKMVLQGRGGQSFESIDTARSALLRHGFLALHHQSSSSRLWTKMGLSSSKSQQNGSSIVHIQNPIWRLSYQFWYDSKNCHDPEKSGSLKLRVRDNRTIWWRRA